MRNLPCNRDKRHRPGRCFECWDSFVHAPLADRIGIPGRGRDIDTVHRHWLHQPFRLSMVVDWTKDNNGRNSVRKYCVRNGTELSTIEFS